MKLSTNQQIFKKRRAYHREQMLRRVGFACLTAIVLLVLVAITLRLPALQLQEISVAGARTLDKESIKEVVEGGLQGNYLGVIPRRNFLLYPKEELALKIREKFLRVATLAFTERSPTSLQIIVSEREPDAVWCEGAFVESGTRQCFYLDHDSILYDQAPVFSGPVYFEMYGSFREAPRLGARVIAEEQLALIQSVRKSLTEIAIEPLAITFMPDGTYELATNKGWKLLFDARGESSLMISHLEAALSSQSLQKRLQDKVNGLAYIDVRFGKKVFYKFKEAEEASTTPTQ